MPVDCSHLVEAGFQTSATVQVHVSRVLELSMFPKDGFHTLSKEYTSSHRFQTDEVLFGLAL